MYSWPAMALSCERVLRGGVAIKRQHVGSNALPVVHIGTEANRGYNNIIIKPAETCKGKKDFPVCLCICPYFIHLVWLNFSTGLLRTWGRFDSKLCTAYLPCCFLLTGLGRPFKIYAPNFCVFPNFFMLITVSETSLFTDTLKHCSSSNSAFQFSSVHF